LCLPNWAMLVACANLLQAGKPEEPRYRCKRRAFFLRKRVKLYKKLLIVRGARKPVTHGLETPVGAMQSSNIAAIAHDDQLDDEIVVGYETKRPGRPDPATDAYQNFHRYRGNDKVVAPSGGVALAA
jgi:hypothetical protein